MLLALCSNGKLPPFADTHFNVEPTFVHRTGPGTRDQNGRPRGDGGCQCSGYCGYQSKGPCMKDKRQCYWNRFQQRCYSKLTQRPGKPILVCPTNRTPAPMAASPTTTAPVITAAPWTKAPYAHPTYKPTEAPMAASPTTTAPVITRAPYTKAPYSRAPYAHPTRKPTEAPMAASPTTTAPVGTKAPSTKAPNAHPTKAPSTKAPSTPRPTRD